MRRLLSVAAGVAGLFLMSSTWAAEDKVPDIHEIMEKTHKSKVGLRAQLETELKKPKADWAEIQKKTKEYVKYAEALPKNEVPKGDKKSWGKLAKEFVDDVKAVDTAAGKKDAKLVAEANKKLGGKCDACHDAHQP